MLNLIIRMKNGDTVTMSNAGTMNDFMFQALREKAITGPDGTWLPLENISHIVPHVVPQVPAEALQQIRPDTETKQ